VPASFIGDDTFDHIQRVDAGELDDEAAGDRNDDLVEGLVTATRWT